MPTILADNVGYDSSDLVVKLWVAHCERRSDADLDMEREIVGSLKECGVMESYELKLQVVLSASEGEAAEIVVWIVNILRAAPRRREGGF